MNKLTIRELEAFLAEIPEDLKDSEVTYDSGFGKFWDASSGFRWSENENGEKILVLND